MNKLRAMRLFVRLADAGSFVAVADEFGGTASMVSKEIRKLEEDLNARLMHRSTRNIQLTPIGEGYLARCREILSQIDDADAYVHQSQSKLSGKLRINVPMALGLTDLGRFFSDFIRSFPDVELDIHLGDESLDLVEHGFDLGFRASSRPFDSNYVGKELKSFTYRVCAAPSYLSTNAEIKEAADLQNHNCFIYSYFRGKHEWPLGEGIKVRGNLRANNTLFMREAVVAGLGIGFFPSFVADPCIKTGEIIEILKDAEKPKLTLYALYPNRRHVPPILAKCIEFMDDWFKKSALL